MNREKLIQMLKNEPDWWLIFPGKLAKMLLDATENPQNRTVNQAVNQPKSEASKNG